jgi:glycosyltransferase involved in cell wall biosynthesis
MHQALAKTVYRPKAYELVHNRQGFAGDSTSYSKDYTAMVVCVSKDAEDYFKSKMPYTPTKVIPNGVDTTIFKPAAKQPKSRLLGRFSGRLEPGDGKGIPQLINLISKLPVDFELVGKDYGGYADLIRKAQIKNISIFHHTQNIVDFYNRWDFFVSRSPAEGFGLSIAEALACGLPSAVYNCGGVCGYLEHGKHALLSSTDEELEKHIYQITEGKVNLDPLSVDFSAKKMAENYEALYEELLNTKISVAPKSIEPLQTEVVKKTVTSLAVTSPDWWGVRRALAPLSDHFCPPEQNTIRVIRDLKPKLVVFGCYMPSWEKILLEAKKEGCKTVLTWHASYILNEFDHTNREWMFHSLKAAKERNFDFIATPHEGLAKTWSSFGLKTDFLPNIVDAELTPAPKSPGINFGILGSGQPWKNMDCQIVAANLFGRGAKVHVQSLQHPQAVDIIGAKYIKHGRVKDDAEYYKLMSEMTINMCLSLSEVYSYFTAESLLLGTPILTTPITPILKKAPKELQPCITPYFEDPVEIVRSLGKILDNYETICKVGRDYMLELNNQNKKIVADTLERWKSDAD